LAVCSCQPTPDPVPGGVGSGPVTPRSDRCASWSGATGHVSAAAAISTPAAAWTATPALATTVAADRRQHACPSTGQAQPAGPSPVGIAVSKDSQPDVNTACLCVTPAVSGAQGRSNLQVEGTSKPEPAASNSTERSGRAGLERIPSPLTLDNDLGKRRGCTALSPRYLIRMRSPANPLSTSRAAGPASLNFTSALIACCGRAGDAQAWTTGR
jgi:hypothetical protein